MNRAIFESIDDIGSICSRQCAESRLDFSYGLLRAIEKSLWGDLAVRYLAIKDANDNIISFMPVYIGTNCNINALLPQPIQNAYNRGVQLLGDAIRTKFLIAGSLISDKGWFPTLEHHSYDGVTEEMVRYIDDYSKENKVKVSLIKDIHCDYPADQLEIIERLGYKRMYSLPTVIVNTEFEKFGNYITSLTKNARKHARKVLNAAKNKYTFEVINNYGGYVDSVYPLFRQTYLKAKYKFDESLPNFVYECSNSKDPKTEMIVCRRDDAIVGALINFYNSEEQLNKRIGVQYGKEDSALIYTSLMYEGIRSAIEKNINKVYLGQSTYVPKVRLGGVIEDVYFFVKSYDAILSLSLPTQVKWSRGYAATRVDDLAHQGVSV